MERKELLRAAGIYQSHIARETGVSQALVSRVLKGDRWRGDDARKVMGYVAQSLNTDLVHLFPESTRQWGWRRREWTPKAVA
jgi:transcriptional regulator with XRE-family HTH domain